MFENEKQLRQALKIAEARYAAIVEDQTELILRFFPDGRISFVNGAVCRFFSRPRQELIDLSLVNLLGPEPAALFRRSLCSLNWRNNFIYIETCVKVCLHSLRWIGWNVRSIEDEHGLILEYQACGRDITDMKDAETKVQQSEERYRILVEQASDGILVANANGYFVEVNPSACVMLGYSRDELLTMNIYSLVVPEETEHYIREMDRVRAGESVIIETQLLCKDGATFPAEISANALSDGRFQSFVRDISSRKQLEKEIIRLDRLNLVGEIAVGIAHEIRNPLTTIRGYSQMLSQRSDLRKYSETFQLLLSEVETANSIITEFLSLANNKRMELKIKNLNLIIRSLIRLIAADPAAYHKHLKLDLEDVPLWPLDEEDVRQLIINLVRNGLEAMPAGGTLIIHTYMENSELVLSVEDQGAGIPTDLFDKLGTPFFTTKPEGTGLGLAVCYSIANRHNAYVRFKTGSQGTTFYIRFRPFQA